MGDAYIHYIYIHFSNRNAYLGAPDAAAHGAQKDGSLQLSSPRTAESGRLYRTHDDDDDGDGDFFFPLPSLLSSPLCLRFAWPSERPESWCLAAAAAPAAAAAGLLTVVVASRVCAFECDGSYACTQEG